MKHLLVVGAAVSVTIIASLSDCAFGLAAAEVKPAIVTQ